MMRYINDTIHTVLWLGSIGRAEEASFEFSAKDCLTEAVADMGLGIPNGNCKWPLTEEKTGGARNIILSSNEQREERPLTEIQDLRMEDK